MKRLLLIDAVEFPPEMAPQQDGSVFGWFQRHFYNVEEAELFACRASSPTLEAEAARADGIILSGSPRDAWKDDPIITRLMGLVHVGVNSGQPFLGVCFGHQLLARAFGGEVARNPQGWELGAREACLTAAGRQSPLFAGISAPLIAIQSHQDAVLTLPAGATLLASNTHTPIQAFSIGAHGFGVQFHPEMNGAMLRRLWLDRRDRLRSKVAFDLDGALDSAGETDDVPAIFHNFAEIVKSR